MFLTEGKRINDDGGRGVKGEENVEAHSRRIDIHAVFFRRRATAIPNRLVVIACVPPQGNVATRRPRNRKLT